MKNQKKKKVHDLVYCLPPHPLNPWALLLLPELLLRAPTMEVANLMEPSPHPAAESLLAAPPTQPPAKPEIIC